jgi:hypothetical protein
MRAPLLLFIQIPFAKFLLPGFIFLSINSFCQSGIDSIVNKIDPQRFISSVTSKARKLEKNLTEKSNKILLEMEREEQKIYQKMIKAKDSIIAKAKIEEIKNKYSSIRKSLAIENANKYIPELDTIITSFKFLQQMGVSGDLDQAILSTAALQQQFNVSEHIKQFLNERKEQLKTSFKKFRITKRLQKINKKVYYYSAQLKEYRNLLKDPKKIQKKAIELLGNTKIFQEFMKKNS